MAIATRFAARRVFASGCADLTQRSQGEEVSLVQEGGG